MEGFCPLCEKVVDLEDASREEEMVIRGESIPVHLDFVKCPSCKEELMNPENNIDSMDVALTEYRRRHNMLSPDEIKELRKKYGLTQEELANLLGFGVATLSRYENGALQSEAQDIMLRLVRDDPQNLLRLIEEHPYTIDDEKRDRLISELKEEEKEKFSTSRIFIKWFGHSPDIFSGFKELNLQKLFSAILLFCSDDRVFTTKLNKLLFYSDFSHFKNHGFGITGLKYIAIAHGPAPEQWDFYFGELVREGMLGVEEVTFKDGSGYRYWSIAEPDLSIFPKEELATLFRIKEYFKDYTATQIKERSHEESAYTDNADKEEISYEYAKDLKIPA